MTADSSARSRCFHPSGRFVEFKREEIEQSIPQRFEKIVLRYPDCLAVKTKTHALTYKELNRTANRVAHGILSRRAATKEPAALLMEHDAPVIASILGALKAGKFYVPLDPSLPHSRIKHIVQDLQLNYMVTNAKNLSLAESIGETALQLINIDELNDFDDRNPCIGAQPGDLSWVIYTSGSTGQPKGVMQNHRNVLHFMMNYTNALHICSDDRLTLLFSFSVNGGAHDIFAALLNGATLYPVDLKAEGFTHLGEWLRQERVNVYHSVPTVFRQFCENLTDEEKFPDLRIVRLGGEPVYRREFDLFKKHFEKDCILVNRLGSSETGSLRMYFLDEQTQISGNLVPVGYAVRDNEILLLDDAGKQTGGDEGEIAVKTRYVSPGYWGRQDLTDAVFVTAPEGGKERIYRTGDLGRMLPDACLLHLGRKDFFVKIRGYQVDLDEIETVLSECPGVKEAIVFARDNNSGAERLVAYLVSAAQPGPNVSELRAFLRTKLPEYMIPAAFVVLDSIPLTATSKIDRKALPDPGTSRPHLATEYAAPRNSIEEKLAQIWAEVLSLEQIGIHDDFFDLGGHSLAATRVISRVIAVFRLQLPIQALFDSPTVAAMSIVISNSNKKADEENLRRLLNEVESRSAEEVQRLRRR
jgi:amino acid adenylation domain-containing protein